MELLLSPQNLFEYLIDRGICTPENQSMSKIEIKPAKNFNLLLTFPEGKQLLIKQERRSSNGKTAGEFFREWQIQTMLQTLPQLSHIRFSVSEAIYFDADNSIIVFNYLNDYRDLADFYTRENIFPTKIAARIGATLALIHSLTRDSEQYRERFQSDLFVNHELKFIQSVNRLTPEQFSALSTDALKFFVIYQRYDSLRQAIAELINSIESFCLTHNDLKLNNILLAKNWEHKVTQTSLVNNIIRLIDWEKCNWGDPAYDLGMLIASYLQAWLLSLMTSKTISLEETLRIAKTPLELVQPSIAALMKAYLKNFPEILNLRPDFLPRVVQFTGLGLVLTIIATLQHHKTFGNQGICMLQVAKSLLCRPEQSILTVFGVTAVELAHRSALRAIK